MYCRFSRIKTPPFSLSDNKILSKIPQSKPYDTQFHHYCIVSRSTTRVPPAPPIVRDPLCRVVMERGLLKVWS